jgi:hypothetical protein
MDLVAAAACYQLSRENRHHVRIMEETNISHVDETRPEVDFAA